MFLCHDSSNTYDRGFYKYSNRLKAVGCFLKKKSSVVYGWQDPKYATVCTASAS